MWNPIQSCLIECFVCTHVTRVRSHQFGIFSHIDRITMQTALTFTSVNPRVACAAQAKRTVRVNAEPINQFVFVYPVSHSLTHSLIRATRFARSPGRSGRTSPRSSIRPIPLFRTSLRVRVVVVVPPTTLTHSLTHSPPPPSSCVLPLLEIRNLPAVRRRARETQLQLRRQRGPAARQEMKSVIARRFGGAIQTAESISRSCLIIINSCYISDNDT
jgi:hypothetical protein